MWASTIADLAAMSIGTDYARVVRAVFTLAQIRLLRGDARYAEGAGAAPAP
jgi:uncharacterized protein YaaW (UPF0174 family)